MHKAIRLSKADRLAGDLHVLHVGLVPLPQTDPAVLAARLYASPPGEWRAILANEVLLYLESAYRYGHPEAAPDARQWCRSYRLPVPDWLRDAPDHPGRKGRRSDSTKLKQFLTESFRFEMIEEGAEPKTKTARIREMARYDGKTRRLPGQKNTLDTDNVDYISKRYYKFKKDRDFYYLSPTSLMKLLDYYAPAIRDILR